jgi:hypothetical protein
MFLFAARFWISPSKPMESAARTLNPLNMFSPYFAVRSCGRTGWRPSKVKYVLAGGNIQAQEPEIFGQPAREFVSFRFDRLTCFVEEVTTHGLQLQMPPEMALTEIPMSEREPVRFRPTLKTGGMPVWRILHHRDKFEEVR